MKKANIDKKIKYLLKLEKKFKEAPELSPVEKEAVEAERRFEAVYYSNRLEGNTLSKEEARKAILSD